MLDLYYLREAPLPRDVEEVARLIRLRKNVAEVEAVLVEFFELTEDGWRHARCDEEIEKMQDKQAKARASAAASVKARQTKAERPLSERSASVERTLDERPAEAELPTPTPTPIPIQEEAIAPSCGQLSQPAEDAPRKRGAALPGNWSLPDDWAAWARSERPDLDPVKTAERFADYWRAVPGAKGRKTDWLATWRNWVRNSRPGEGSAIATRPTSESFAERDARRKREQWEEMTGRKWPGSSSSSMTLDAVSVTPLELLQ